MFNETDFLDPSRRALKDIWKIAEMKIGAIRDTPKHREEIKYIEELLRRGDDGTSRGVSADRGEVYPPFRAGMPRPYLVPRPSELARRQAGGVGGRPPSSRGGQASSES